MKFGYSYKTSDGVRHEAVFEAKTKEDVFSSLRANGIKPIKVWPIYSRFHVRRSVIVISALVVSLLISLFFAVKNSQLESRALKELGFVRKENTSPRHQIYGDPARMEELESDGYSSVLTEPGDRFLAAYAIPGKPISKDGLQPAENIRRHIKEVAEKDFEISEKDPTEIRELKLILNGMKQELREYLADGVGTIDTYIMRLRERQEEEMRIYERVRRELESVTDMKLKEERNSALRAMGVRTIPRPRIEKDRQSR